VGERPRPAILWVPKTRPGMLSRRFARLDRIRAELTRRIGFVAMPPVRAEVAGVPTNQQLAKAANTAKRLVRESNRSDGRASASATGRFGWIA
jgi:hypothetical protein